MPQDGLRHHVGADWVGRLGVGQGRWVGGVLGCEQSRKAWRLEDCQENGIIAAADTSDAIFGHNTGVRRVPLDMASEGGSGDRPQGKRVF